MIEPPNPTGTTQTIDEVINGIGQTAYQRQAVRGLIAAYGGTRASSIYRLLRDLGDQLDLSLAYVDRNMIEAHLDRILSAEEWNATARQFGGLDFDGHVGDAGAIRTDWIDTVLDKAGVLGSRTDNGRHPVDRSTKTAHAQVGAVR